MLPLSPSVSHPVLVCTGGSLPCQTPEPLTRRTVKEADADRAHSHLQENTGAGPGVKCRCVSTLPPPHCACPAAPAPTPGTQLPDPLGILPESS